MRLTKHETACVEYLREYAREGFPRRVDGSFPADVLTAFRAIMKVPVERMGTREFERAISAGRDFDVRLSRHWSSTDITRWKEKLS